VLSIHPVITFLWGDMFSQVRFGGIVVTAGVLVWRTWLFKQLC